MHCSLVSLGCVFGFSPAPNQVTLTALRALKIAQRRLRPEVRSKLMGVSSARTDESFLPNAWRFTFMDPGTSGKNRVVTVAAKTSSEHPDTIESFKAENSTYTQVIAQDDLLIDSNKALEKARSSVKLRGVLAAEYHLVQPRKGGEPIWNIHFFADMEEPVALMQIGAKTGAVEMMKMAQAA